MDTGIHAIPNISLKVNAIAQLKFEIVYYDSAAQYFNHCAMGTRSPSPMCMYIFTQPSARAGYNTRSICKQFDWFEFNVFLLDWLAYQGLRALSTLLLTPNSKENYWISTYPRSISTICSPMVRETGVQSRVESYQRLKKWY